MKLKLKKQSVGRIITALVGLLLSCHPSAGQSVSYTLTALHSFANTNTDGGEPFCGLVLSGNTLYGTAGGGTSGNGVVFAINTNGSGCTNLYNFTGGTANYDGSTPRAGLVLSGTNLYGAAMDGGIGSVGTLFAVSTEGSFTNLYNFSVAGAYYPYTNGDGANPQARLVLSGNTLYGVAESGGTAGVGTIFAFNLVTGVFTNLHSFATLVTGTNSDGASPSGALVLSGNTLYGTAQNGGTVGGGAVFAIKTDGTEFTNLYNFTEGNDGASPRGGLVLSGSTLYGTTEIGGSNYSGTVFAIGTDGTDFTNLYDFTGGADGNEPVGGLTLSENTLYGTTEFGGSNSVGNIFALHTDGSGFTNLYNFTAPDPTTSTNTDGYFPQATLLVSGDTLYGTTPEGGNANLGTIFSLSLPVTSSPPRLPIAISGTSVNLTWPADAAGFLLQTNDDLTTTNWADYSGIISTNGSTESVNVVPSVRNLFFRLVKP